MEHVQHKRAGIRPFYSTLQLSLCIRLASLAKLSRNSVRACIYAFFDCIALPSDLGPLLQASAWPRNSMLRSLNIYEAEAVLIHIG